MSSHMIHSRQGAVTGFRHALPVYTLMEVPGKRIVRVVGMCRGNTIRARHIGRDITAAFKTIFGGEISEYTKMLAESREQAIDRMIDQGRMMGANAIVGVRFTTSTVMQGAAEILAYGTGVVIED